jgi:methyltransferase (TIGR00027 family)
VKQPELFEVRISDISSTMLLTLYAHSIESQSNNPIINDPKAVEITAALKSQMSNSPDRMCRDLAAGKLDGKFVVFTALRTKRFDQYSTKFLQESPAGTIVNLGCGLDTRFWRIDNGRGNFYDLDLPEVIAIKRRLCTETDRYHMIASSVLDYDWMAGLRKQNTGPFLFLAEGLFMYLERDDVRNLVVKLQSEFPGSELVCEVVNESMIRGPMKQALNIKMQRQFHIGSGATFNFGVRDGHDIESWSPGIKLLDEWSHFDSNEKKLGWVRMYGKIPSMRRRQWTVHYRLGQVESRAASIPISPAFPYTG